VPRLADRVCAALLGALVASSLSGNVESDVRPSGFSLPLRRSRSNVAKLSGLFAIDAFAGGFIVQSFIAYWFRAEYGISTETLGAIFFCVGLLQAGSFLAATRLAERIGLLNTMVFTHLPSNLLLMAIPLAPTLGAAIGLLFARFALSQMDVPTRQAYIAALVDPSERTAAAAYTNTARYAVRPLGPLLAGLSQQLAFGLPFFVGGGVKAAYDLVLWQWFRRVPVDGEQEKGAA
jgi:predicted MFS family arabinose efflux permease